MSKIQITASGTQAWRDRKRRRALTSAADLSRGDHADAVCVDTHCSVVVLSATALASDGGKREGRDQPANPALRLHHDCEPTASSLFHRRFAARIAAEGRPYELQDVSFWMPEESSDEDESRDRGCRSF
jgi:hypothetical protein